MRHRLCRARAHHRRHAAHGLRINDARILPVEAKIFKAVTAPPACLMATQRPTGVSFPAQQVELFDLLPLANIEFAVGGASEQQTTCLLERLRPLDARLTRLELNSAETRTLLTAVAYAVGLYTLLQLNRFLAAATTYCHLHNGQGIRYAAAAQELHHLA